MNKKFAIVLALSLIAIVCCAGCIDPQEPVDPVDPVVPVDPVDPVTPPVDPVVPAVEYSVFFMLNYDGAGAYTAETVTAGDAVSKPATPTRSGYTFKGWFTAAEGGAEYDFTQAVNADLTLYAQWSKKSSSSSGSSTPKHTHSYGDWISNEDGTHIKSCSCGGSSVVEACKFSGFVCTICGYKGDVYHISSLIELLNFANEVNNGESFEGKTVVLDADIDLSSYSNWAPIGKSGAEFDGTFDGNGKTISNMKVTINDNSPAGLFGVSPHLVKNVTLKNVMITAHYKAGAVVGDGLCSMIENCHVDGGYITITPYNSDDGNHAGGIVGYLSTEPTAWVKGCSVKNLVITAYRDVGGIAGTVTGDPIESNSVTGNSVSDVTIIADQVTGNYAEKAFNAGVIVGRDAASVANAESNTGSAKITYKVANTYGAQAALDEAKEGTTIQLTPGVNYDKLYVRPTAHNDVTMICESDNYKTTDAEKFKAHLADGQWHTTPKYNQEFKDVTIIGAEGATVNGLVITSGHAHGTVHDYVRSSDITGSAYYLTLNITNLEFQNVNFTDQVNICTSQADSVYDGVTFEGCAFTTGGTASTNGAAIRYYNEANNGKTKNIVVNVCTFKNCYQGVYVQNVSGITVTDCTFDTTGHNAIAMQGNNVNLKNVVITGNEFTNIHDRVIRFGNVGDGSTIMIQGNTATNSGDENNEVMKAESIAAGVTTSISGNNWGTATVVFNDELKDQ